MAFTIEPHPEGFVIFENGEPLDTGEEIDVVFATQSAAQEEILLLKQADRDLARDTASERFQLGPY